MFDFITKLFTKSESEDLVSLIKNNAYLVDVRTQGEFNNGSIDGAVNIPLDKVKASISKFKGKTSVIVFCRSGNRSGQAKSILEQNGIENVYNGGSVSNMKNYI